MFTPTSASERQSSSLEVLTAFLNARALEGPDGRPLYAYRCSAREADELECTLRNTLLNSPLSIGLNTAQAFCLWASEYWRRQYRGGPWKWGQLLAVIGAEHLSPGTNGYPRLRSLVGEGLLRWKRSVLRIGSDRLFLVTLACEGGLPLHLVTREQARLRRYFRALFEELHLYRKAGAPSAGVSVQELAKRVESELPSSLRHDVVFELSAQLVETIWGLLADVGDGNGNILGALDRRRPGWRGELPLDLDDDVAKAFLNGLLAEASAVAHGAGATIRWTRVLRLSTSLSTTAAEANALDGAFPTLTWELTGRIELPPSIRVEQLASVFDRSAFPPHFDLCLRVGGETEVVALGTTRPKDGVVTFERSPRAFQPVRGAAAAEGRSLVARDGRSTYGPATAFRGALPLSPLPWVFAARSDVDDRHYELVSEGSVRVRTPEAIVVIADEIRVECAPGATCTSAGRVRDIELRSVFRVSGTVTFRDPSGIRCVVVTNSTDVGEALDYRLAGRRMEFTRADSAAFLGVPRVLAESERGASVRIQPQDLQWRSALRSAQWCALTPSCLGEGSIRRITAGEVRFSARVRVLPERFDIRYVPTGDADGWIELHRTAGAHAAVEPIDGLDVRTERSPDMVRLQLTARGPLPATVLLHLIWDGRGAIDIALPFPANHVAFRTIIGQALAAGTTIAVGQLTRVVATALAPRRGEEFHIEGTYRRPGKLQPGASPPRPSLIVCPLAESVGGMFALDMAVMQRHIAEQLTSSDEVDGCVRVRIASDGLRNLAPTSLDVTRYDLKLDRDGKEFLRLSDTALARLTPTEVGNLRLEAFPLVDPNTEPVPLIRLGGAVWMTPDTERFRPGPWLVVGWDGGWCRVRPILCDVAGDRADVADGGLAWACLQMPDVRRRAMPTAVSTLAGDPGHADWDLLAGFVRWTTDLPPNTFDALRVLVTNPDAVALAAILIPEENPAQLDTLWRALNALPFSWHAVPRASWHRAMASWVGAKRHAFDLLGDQLAALGHDPTHLIFTGSYQPTLERLTASQRMRWLAPVFDSACRGALGMPESADTRALKSGRLSQHFLSCYGNLIKESPAQVNDRTVPRAPDVLRHRDRVRAIVGIEQLWVAERVVSNDVARHSYVNAPAIAAVCAAANVALDPSAQIQLRSVHDFDPVWFADVYRCAYLYTLGLLSQA